MVVVEHEGEEVNNKYKAYAEHRPRVGLGELRQLARVDNLCRERRQKQYARHKREYIYNP